MPTLDEAKQQLSQYTTANWGRAPTDAEWAKIGEGIDYSSGNISDAQLQQAYGNTNTLAGSYGLPPGTPVANQSATTTPATTNTAPYPGTGGATTTPAPTTGATTTNPYAGVNPTTSLTGTQALTNLQQTIGRPLTSAEIQQAMTLIGYTDQSGNTPLTGTQYNQLLQEAARRTPGANYTAPAAPAGPATTPPPTGPAAPTGPLTPPYGVNVPSNLQSTIGNLFNQQPASPIQSAYQTSLLDLIKRSEAPVSLTDPNLAAQSEQYRATRQRGTERERAALAERAAQTGTLGAGGFDTAVGNLLGAESRDIAGKDVEIVAKEMDARRQQLMQGLQLAQATGNAEAERLLRTQLGLLEQAMGESQFGRELLFRQQALGQQGELGRGDIATRLLSILLGSDLGYDTLGSNNANFMANLNQNALIAALTGM